MTSSLHALSPQVCDVLLAHYFTNLSCNREQFNQIQWYHQLQTLATSILENNIQAAAFDAKTLDKLRTHITRGLIVILNIQDLPQKNSQSCLALRHQTYIPHGVNVTGNIHHYSP